MSSPPDYRLLPGIASPRDLDGLSRDELLALTDEIRRALIGVMRQRPAHFASNLGVVELCVALHKVFDSPRDRIIWDTGHQIYPHKLLTGRFAEFDTIRERGGLMGYPNPAESEHDLFMTGHAGASVSTVLGLKAGDDLARAIDGDPRDRKSVAVIGDGALPSGIVFEAMNNAAELKKDLLVVLNDNKMGICPRVGGLATYLDQARSAPFYNGLKRDVSWLLNRLPVVGDSVEQVLAQAKDAVKTFLHGGMLFEEMGLRYIGPVDGHDLPGLIDKLTMVREVSGPVLLHVLTEKGKGFDPAVENPVKFHSPGPFDTDDDGCVVSIKTGSGGAAYTNLVSESLADAMTSDERVAVLTAAMCAGNKLEKIRDDFPERFFDVGICEGHAVAFAGGMAKAGLKPVVDIYSTFLQRSFDQIFQEVALQNLPVVFTLDRAGLVGPDGPTHHGMFDLSYMRTFPNMTVMAPGDAADVGPMLRFALAANGPTSLRYPKCVAEAVERVPAPIEQGKAEVYSWGEDGVFLVCGAQFADAVRAADRLREEDGLEFGVVNMRFVKPVDADVVERALAECGRVITVEENSVAGGFGAAVLEAAAVRGLDASKIKIVALPDAFVEHGGRDELLASCGLDEDGLYEAARDTAGVAVPANL